VYSAQEVSNSAFLAMGAVSSVGGGLWFLSHANRKAKKPYAPPTSYADYLGVFLMILGVILGVLAAKGW
jgi:hypothetical protein